MTTYHGYETPDEGDLEWHIPLNENFRRIDKDVEIRDVESNLGEYTPNEGAKFLATDTFEVYLGDGSDWTRVGSLSNSSGSDTPLPKALSAGNVVAVAGGLETAIDPAGTATPVQEALDRIANADTSGIVYLPPGKTSDTGPITVPVGAQGAQIRGVGASTGGQPVSQLTITGSNEGFRIGDYGFKFVYLDGFTLHGNGGANPAILCQGNRNPRMFGIGRLNFTGWDGTSTGVMHWDNASPWSCHFRHLHFGATAGPSIKFDGKGPLAARFDNILSDGATAHPVIDVNNEAPNLDIGVINVGGANNRVINCQTMTGNGSINVRFMNFEPKDTTDVTSVNRLNGPGIVNLETIRVTAGSGLNSVDQVVELGFNNGRNVIGQVQVVGNVSVDNNVINVTEEPVATSWYYGPASDIADTSGSSTGLVRSLATAGQGNA